MPNQHVAYGADSLDEGICSHFVEGVNGLRFHVLEAGNETGERPAVLLLHGFPELAFSWRKIIGPLADKGLRVLAPDMRGYGLTSGWDADYDGDLDSFRMLNFVKDVVALLHALGIESVDVVVGHDYGSPVAGWCALIRPDIFKSVVLMSAPFAGPPALPFASANADAPRDPVPVVTDMDAGLAALARPRRNYRWYYSMREANPNMWQAEQGVADFLRAYYHMKSADWAANKPFRLASWEPAELAQMPTYYIMDRTQGMAETVANEMPDQAAVDACQWLTDQELSVYAAEYGRNGFQGGLNSYRCGTDPARSRELSVFARSSITVPACFIGGASDWGVYQTPGALERMQGQGCTDFRGLHLIAGAGHWVQQEQPQAVVDVLLDFLRPA
jgi:pimeloyl-ACP methyl ester carboxylesterase